jgi:hypothetical protein
MKGFHRADDSPKKQQSCNESEKKDGQRAWTTSFGSAALGGFLLAVIQTLKAIAETKDDRSDNGALACLKCMVLCLLACLESCIQMITRYALIYCATFSVPFVEGCRRWAELARKKFVDCLITGNIIEECLAINWLVFSIGGHSSRTESGTESSRTRIT